MKKFIVPIFLLLAYGNVRAQYTEEWSEPVLLTDTLSFNSNPCVFVLEANTWMFYEKKFSMEGPSKIYYRDIKNMGNETELLGDVVHSFRNPVVMQFGYPDWGFCLFYESDLAGNFDLYALRFDDALTFGPTFQLTWTASDENNTSVNGDYAFASWENNGNILTAKIVYDPDTVFLENTETIDYAGCSRPICCGYRIVYLKMQDDSAAVFYSDWDYWQGGQWGDPVAMDTTGNNGYCSCDQNMWYMSGEDCIVYGKDGLIFNRYYDQTYLLELPGFDGDMQEPHSALYDIPVESLPAPVFITFSSSAEGNKDIYVYWSLWGGDAENISNDNLVNSNPRLSWGWYAPAPCSRYFLNIWETGQNGFVPLYLSKCALYVCGSTDEKAGTENRLEVFPNPFSDELTIRFIPESREDVIVEIRTATGKLVKSFTNPSLPGEWNEVLFIPDSNTPSGILNITLKQGDNRLFRKVIFK